MNAFDGLGEAYELSGQLDSAVEAFTTAVDLAKKQKDANLSMYQSNLNRVLQKKLQ